MDASYDKHHQHMLPPVFPKGYGLTGAPSDVLMTADAGNLMSVAKSEAGAPSDVLMTFDAGNLMSVAKSETPHMEHERLKDSHSQEQ
eukprot:8979868-Karenia_brevis.AAC.1